MKRILLVLITLVILSCADAPKNYATISGKITNQNSDSLVIRKQAYSKTIEVADDGSFKDTLNVEPGVYTLYDGREGTSLFLRNGFDIQVTLDTKMFDETVSYAGEGATHSNFLAKKTLLEEELFDLDALIVMDSVSREAEFQSIENQLKDFQVKSKQV